MALWEPPGLSWYGAPSSGDTVVGERPEGILGDGRKKLSTTVYITQEQSMRLKLLHQLTRVPISEYVREGIDLVLSRYQHKIPAMRDIESSDSEPRDPEKPTRKNPILEN